MDIRQKGSAAEHKLHILLVEDNPADVYLMREALNENRVAYLLENIADGEEAIRFVQSVRVDTPLPDLIILDLNLPKVEGGEILEAIRRNDAFADVPVVVLTSSDSPEDKNHAARFGAKSYIRKPSSLEAFLEIGAQIKSISVRSRAQTSR